LNVLLKFIWELKNSCGNIEWVIIQFLYNSTVSEPNTGDYRKRYFFYDGQDLIGFHGGNILESIEHFRSSLRIQVM